MQKHSDPKQLSVGQTKRELNLQLVPCHYGKRVVKKGLEIVSHYSSLFISMLYIRFLRFYGFYDFVVGQKMIFKYAFKFSL